MRDASGPTPQELRALGRRRSASKERARGYLLAMCHRAMERVARGGGKVCLYTVPPFLLGLGRYDPVEMGGELKRELRGAGYRVTFDRATVTLTVMW